jgi:serine/threonine protein phosphatase PrpC
MKPIAIEIATKTDDGIVRKGHNEDDFTVIAANWGHAMNRINPTERGVLLMVADGMGGTNAGEVASKIAVKSVETSMEKLKRVPNTDKNIEEFLTQTIEEAHKSIVEHARNHLESAGMGTTAVLVWVLNNKAHIGWCGDSRCYIFRKGIAFRPRTEDHSLVWQEIVGDAFSPEKAEVARLHPDSNIILQSLGEEAQPPKPSSKTVELQTGDRLIVCSDGLNAMLSDRDIAAIVSRLDFSPKQICDQLIIAANAAGGTDNITVITADFDVNNTPISGQKTVHEFQESSSATTSKTLRNVLLGVLGCLLVGAMGWFLLPKTPKPSVPPRHSARPHDSITGLPITHKTEDDSDDAPPKPEPHQGVHHSVALKTPIRQQVPKPSELPKPSAVENKVNEQPMGDEKLIARITKLKARRSDIGEYLRKQTENGLPQTLKDRPCTVKVFCWKMMR